jgi:hypothetical protein
MLIKIKDRAEIIKKRKIKSAIEFVVTFLIIYAAIIAETKNPTKVSRLCAKFFQSNQSVIAAAKASNTFFK